PLVVNITQGGVPAPNVTVTWTATGGTVASGTSSTDANGRASNTFTPTAATGQVTASVPGGVSGAFSEAANPAPLAIGIVSARNQTSTIGAPLRAPLVVRVTQNGVPIAGQTVTWTATGGTLGAATSVTDAAGQTSNTLTPTAATSSATASVPGSSVTFTAAHSPAALAVPTRSGCT